MTRKQIAFDIDTKIAEEILGKKYRSIYENIRKYLGKNGFEHLQGSVYVSKEALSNTKVTAIINGLLIKYNYLEKCVRDIRKTDITKEHSLNHLFSYDGTPGDYAIKKEKVKKQATKKQKKKSR
ncbi:MAG: hypothetical protein K2N51_08810 [Lachnospiraceae bacterium]|nr:hypothetical protein [Lachnospiraceae bacterium]